MANVPDNLEALLLDYHLGQLEPDEVDAVEKLIADQPEVARHSERVAAIIGRLDGYTVPDPPAGLVEGVLGRIEQYRETTVRVDEIASVGGGIDLDGKEGGSGWWSMRELLALAASLVIIVGLLVPGYHSIRQTGMKNACSANLASLGSAVSSYAGEHGDALPFAGTLPASSWLPVRAAPGRQKVQYAPNVRHFVPLATDGYVEQVQLLVCPSSQGGVRVRSIDPRGIGGVGRLASVSYSSQNLGTEGTKITLSPRMPLLADRNPFVGDGWFRIVGSSDRNSNAHGRSAGQNVLYFDGSVQWKQSPTAGPSDDHIWLAGVRREYQGTELPQYTTDAFLIP